MCAEFQDEPIRTNFCSQVWKFKEWLPLRMLDPQSPPALFNRSDGKPAFALDVMQFYGGGVDVADFLHALAQALAEIPVETPPVLPSSPCARAASVSPVQEQSCSSSMAHEQTLQVTRNAFADAGDAAAAAATAAAAAAADARVLDGAASPRLLPQLTPALSSKLSTESLYCFAALVPPASPYLGYPASLPRLCHLRRLQAFGAHPSATSSPVLSHPLLAAHCRCGQMVRYCQVRQRQHVIQFELGVTWLLVRFAFCKSCHAPFSASAAKTAGR